MRTLALTLGDPAGVGPEVARKALTQMPRPSDVHILVIGPQGLAQDVTAGLGTQATALPLDAFSGPIGRPTAASGAISLAALHRAIALAQEGQVDGIVTAPISKEALVMSGSTDLGHTEILRRGLARGPVAMAFFSERLRLVLASVHVPLRTAVTQLSTTRVVEVGHLFHEALQTIDEIAAPRLALAGLNPHAGEGGIIGAEEIAILAPAVQTLRAQGVSISDPIAPDVVFRQCVDGLYDGVVALYHDQGLIPIKLLAFGTAVNVTLGLSIPRTSPDHGTAYDIAGQNRASPDGMCAALALGLRLLRRRVI